MLKRVACGDGAAGELLRTFKSGCRGVAVNPVPGAELGAGLTVNLCLLAICKGNLFIRSGEDPIKRFAEFIYTFELLQ